MADQASIERDLITVARRSLRLKRQLSDVDEHRDRVIRDAIKAKIPRARIVEITELSPQRIDQIRRGSRV